ncbi:MAG: hypothetical protein P8X91_07980 [Candidatus Bathyarchaeota archaeon]
MVNEESLILTLSLLREEKQFGHMFETKLDSLNLKLNFNPLHFKEKIPDIRAFIHFICNNYFDLVTITTKLDWQKNYG